MTGEVLGREVAPRAAIYLTDPVRAILRIQTASALPTQNLSGVALWQDEVLGPGTDEESALVQAGSYARIREIAGLIADQMPHRDGWIGIGGEIGPARSILESYGEADRAITLAKAAQLRNRIVSYADVTMIEAIALDPRLRQRLMQILEPVATYDRRKRGSLVVTLNQYLDEDLSAVATARSLGIHRHTFDYRLRQIEELSDRSLSDLTGRMLIEASVLARRLDQADL